jgi:hypothetical protein
MSHVYRARRIASGEIVAIKCLHFDELASDFERRLRREPEIQQGIGHENIVRLLEWFRLHDEFFLVMEYVEGETLAQILQSGPLRFDRARGYFRQLLHATAHLHDLGIIHRDIKPGNILIGGDDRVKLADFGIAKFAWQQKGTRTQLGLGTPEYMSPEQVRGGDLDHRTDIYSLGITLFEMLTARRPFARTDTTPMAYAEVIREVLDEPLPDPRVFQPAIPSGAVALLDRATAKDPDDRFRTSDEFLGALDAIESEDHSPATTIIGSMPAATVREKEESVLHGDGDAGLPAGTVASASSGGPGIVSKMKRMGPVLRIAAILLAATALFASYRIIRNRDAGVSSLRNEDALPIAMWVAGEYQTFSRSKNAEAIASLFDSTGLHYMDHGPITRLEVAREQKSFYAKVARVDRFDIQVADAMLKNDSTIVSSWRSSYRRSGSDGTVTRGSNAMALELRRRGSEWKIVSLQRNGPTLDSVWMPRSTAKPAGSAQPQARRSGVSSGGSESIINFAPVEKWVRRQLESFGIKGKGHAKKKHGKEK